MNEKKGYVIGQSLEDRRGRCLEDRVWSPNWENQEENLRILMASSRQNLEMSCSQICRTHWDLEWNKEESGHPVE